MTSRTGSNNFSSFSDARADELLTLGRTVASGSQESIDLCNEAPMVVIEEVSCVCVNYTDEISLHHPWVEGWHIHTGNSNAYQDLHLVKLNR